MPEPAAHSITCGCGFTAHSDNSDVIRDLLDSHHCPNAPTITGWASLWNSLFSPWTMLILVVVAYGAVHVIAALHGGAS
jgi:hypothetical protein